LWSEAAAADEASFAASVAWVKRTNRTLAQQDFHSLSWLHYTYLQQGRFIAAGALAEPIARAIEEGRGDAGTAAPGEHHREHHAVESEIGRGYGALSLENELAAFRARYVVETGEWARMRGQSSFGNVDELFALGLSSVRLGDLARAEAAREHLETARRTVPDRDQVGVVEIMSAQVTGLLLLARGQQQAGLAALARSVEMEAHRPPPVARPYPVKPAAELYGEALLAGGDPRAAVAAFERALARTPRRALALLGLARAAREAGKAALAARAARDLLGVWSRADHDLPALAEARALAALTGG
jgi:tetratricopeptide (TPR) repeat protein